MVNFKALWTGDTPALYLFGISDTSEGIRGEWACAMRPLPEGTKLEDEGKMYRVDEPITEFEVFELLKDVRLGSGHQDP